MFELFLMDAARWVKPSKIYPVEELTFRQVLKLLNKHFSLRLMFWFRLGQWARRKRIPFLGGLMFRFLLFRFGCEIRIDTNIQGGLYIAHPVGTVIAARDMGENCSVIHNVTIGMRNEYDFPRIGDNVFIGAGARVLGGIEIGDDAKIGANSVVMKDIPAGGTAVGAPARVISVYGERVTQPQ